MVTRDPTYCPTCGTALTTVRLEGRARSYCDACDEPVYRTLASSSSTATRSS